MNWSERNMDTKHELIVPTQERHLDKVLGFSPGESSPEPEV
jgi:hypothetical protein